jgi:hypothetical protein
MNDIPETIYYFEDWNNGLGKKYIVNRGPSIPVMDSKGKVVGYENAPETLIEVPRKRNEG